MPHLGHLPDLSDSLPSHFIGHMYFAVAAWSWPGASLAAVFMFAAVAAGEGQSDGQGRKK